MTLTLIMCWAGIAACVAGIPPSRWFVELRRAAVALNVAAVLGYAAQGKWFFMAVWMAIAAVNAWNVRSGVRLRASRRQLAAIKNSNALSRQIDALPPADRDWLRHHEYIAQPGKESNHG